MTKLSIVIPVYNEARTINQVIARCEAVSLPGVEKEIVIVDDGSTDGSREILRQMSDKYFVVLKEKNEGKGSAIKEGFQKASGDVLIIQDSDLEYDPSDYPALLEPILAKHADVVFGSRFVTARPHRVLYYWHYLGNQLLTLLSNICTDLNLSDMEAGYKLFNRRAIDLIRDKITAKRFSIEPELVSLAAHFRLRIYEVGISYSGRTYAEGKKINWKDGIAALYYIIKYNLLR